MSAAIVTFVEHGVGFIELARPKTFNCLSQAAWNQIDKARADFESRNDVRVILICAQGINFCTGADLGDVESARGDAEALRSFIAAGLSAIEKLEACPFPVIAAVQGLCLAGGLELMLGSDIVFAARSAKIGDQHAQFGLIPGWGGSQRLTQLIGARRALDLMFSARWLDAEEARSFGLVNYVVEDESLRREAMSYCTKLAERSRQGLSEMKRLGREAARSSLAGALAVEAKASVTHLMSEDAEEGLAAFGARRKPVFR